MDEIEKYILQYPADTQDILRKIRTLIKSNAPNAEELILCTSYKVQVAYRMPCYKTHKKPLVYQKMIISNTK